MYRCSRTANLLGAAALAIADRLLNVATDAGGSGAGASAALVTLGTEPGIGVTELGTRIRVSQPQAARLAATLASRGLVERRAGRDARSVALHLTARGRAATRRILAARGRELVRLVEQLEPEEQRALTHGLEKLLGHLLDEIGSPDVVCRLCDRAACLAEGATCPVGRRARERGLE
jgi:MarR family transcriptional repressor of emrRAB